ncbi:hypothetical protein XaFJ1_GM001342 [Xanthomonas albilineans]|nr:hypothetical protein XaFJ1_GM001342 [Xanthomonas albilineans]
MNMKEAAGDARLAVWPSITCTGAGLLAEGGALLDCLVF